MTWENWSVEDKDLFNPAFLAVVIQAAAASYEATKKSGIPFELLFLVCPLAIPADTRGRLPATAGKSFGAWIQENDDIRVDFDLYARPLVDVTKSAIMMLIDNGMIHILDNGCVTVPRGKKAALSSDSTDVTASIAAAVLVGKLFSKVGSATNVYAMLGVRP